MGTAVKIFCVNNIKTVGGLNYSVCQNEDASLETPERSNASIYAHCHTTLITMEEQSRYRNALKGESRTATTQVQPQSSEGA